VTIALTIAIFVAAIAGLGWCRASSSRPPTGPSSWSICACRRTPRSMRPSDWSTNSSRCCATIPSLPRVERWSTYIGQGAIRFYLPLNVQLANPFFAQAVIVPRTSRPASVCSRDSKRCWRSEFPQVVGRVSPLELGPPVGWPVQYRVLGPDPTQLRDIAMKLGDLIAANPGTRRVNFDWMEPERELRIRVDQEQARQLGLSSQAVSTALNANISARPSPRCATTSISSTWWRAPPRTEPLGRDPAQPAGVAAERPHHPAQPVRHLRVRQDYPLVWRRDRVPTLTVQADVAPGAMPETVVADLAPSRSPNSNATLPRVPVELGGTVEESADSQASVFAVVPLMLVLMLTLLMVQLELRPALHGGERWCRWG
jgi:multidrug efflux pump subunit AcrB